MLKSVSRTSRWMARQWINSCSVTIRPLIRFAAHNQRASGFTGQFFSTSNTTQKLDDIEPAVFEEICSETLESLCEHFEEIAEENANLKTADITYSDGVLTISLGSEYGTYVINRQTPNKQIWLSSPLSGPKRYDLVLTNGGYWVYKHDGKTLHSLLQEEISKIAKNKVDFTKCSHSL